MSEASPEETTAPEETDGETGLTASLQGMSPYATGGGGVTFERKVAVKYLAHLLVGDGASELGDGRSVVRVEFQQAPDHPVDDLVVTAACPDESLPSLVLALGIRRSPNLVSSDESTRKLIQQFVRAVMNAPTDGPEHRLGLVVAGPQPHAEQLAKLAGLAAVQMDAPGFFDLVRTSGKFDAGIRGRLDQLEKLVKRALHDVGVTDADTAAVQQHAWELLRRLTVCMPRLESPDETDWSAVTNSLIRVARRSDLLGASRLRDRLVALASEYPPKSARVDLKLLRRDAHAMLDSTARHHRQGWEALHRLHDMALGSVRDEITASDGARRVRLDRSVAAEELLSKVVDAAAVVVRGESGVGKSALALIGLTAAGEADPDGVQALCIKLRHVPKLTIQFEATLGCPLSTLLSELSAPQRMLIVDGADAVTEGMDDAFRYLVDAAQESDVKVIAVTLVDSLQVVRDTLTERLGPDVTECAVEPLSDAEIDEIIKTFTELSTQNANPRSRELLRRLVVVDLLVRARVRGIPLTDADTMRAVWSGLVRGRGVSDRGFPDARESALLRLADLDLKGDARLNVINQIDPTALDGLRRDGLLRTSPADPFTIGPEFAHDEVRRYAVARLLLSSDTPASRILHAGAPRWSLSAARLACEAWLVRPVTAATPLKDRFAALQTSFDNLIAAGHGARWGDVPGEALLALTDPKPVLQDAWPGLIADDAAGLRRLARLVVQRHRGDNGIVHCIAIEPIVTLLLDDQAPWRSGKHAENVLRDWLHVHVVASTCAGHPLRIRLRERLVETCAAGDRRLAEEREAAAAKRAARTAEEIDRERRFVESNRELFSEVGYGGRRPRQRPEVPREITDKVVLELLALLGPDLGEHGEAILRRVARDAPSWLAPAVEEPLAGYALANHRRGFLAEMTEAYYLDEEADEDSSDDYGIRDHHARSFGLVPLAASYRGPFMALFRTDPRNGIALLNRLLNHAARIRARILARLRYGQPIDDDAVGPYQIELEISGVRQTYVGDEHVWRWYRGTGVGPYPCISALQELERVCDELIESEVPIRTVVSILLEGCESLAMLSLVVGLLVRHIEKADRLLDPYLTEPLVWRNEFDRVVNESSGLAAGSEGLVAPERRKWSLREAAVSMVLRANADRAEELRALGEKLVANASHHLEPARDGEPTEAITDAGDSTGHQIAQVRAWASSLYRDAYQVHEAADGLYIQATPPEDVVQALEPSSRELERVLEASRLFVRYSIDLKEEHGQPIGPDELVADVAAAKRLFENPPSQRAHDPWDTFALVAAAALEAHILNGVDLPEDALSFATDIVIRIGEREPAPRQYEFEGTFFEQGADRSAARVIPLLLLPAADRIRAVIDERDERPTFERAARAGINLAQAVANEARLHLARGLDHLWTAPCVDRRCHHDVAWRIATETMRRCVLSARTPPTGGRTTVALKEPLTKSLAKANGRVILASRLDAAIRALAPAAMANICVSTRARDLLLVLFAAQRRSLLIHERGAADDRGWHSLVSARALLMFSEDGDDAAIYEHIDAYADNSALLGNLLRGLSASAEETEGRAATARRIWPTVVRHVLELNRSGHAPFDDHCGDMTLASLMPKAVYEGQYLYRELDERPISWWEPNKMRSEVEAWLSVAAGRAECVDQLTRFIGVLGPKDQVRTGLSWVAKLVLADHGRTAGHAFVLPTWLVEIRSAAIDAGLLASWQEVVDALVVAGVTRLAPYSV